MAFGGGKEAETSGLGGPPSLLLRKSPSRWWAKTSWAPLNLYWELKQNPSGCSQRGWQVRGWIWFGKRSQPWWGFSPLLGWSARRPLPSWQSASVHLASQTPASQNQLWPKVGNNNEPSFLYWTCPCTSLWLPLHHLWHTPCFTNYGSSLLRVLPLLLGFLIQVSFKVTQKASE